MNDHNTSAESVEDVLREVRNRVKAARERNGDTDLTYFMEALCIRIEQARQNERGNSSESPNGSFSESAPAYGIIDPDYARIYTIARCLAWAEGYALSVHGSFTRDLDLIATPWTEGACDPEKLAGRIIEAAGLREKMDNPGRKPHGRLVWTMHLPGFGEPRWVDLSVMPKVASAQPLLSQPAEGLSNASGRPAVVKESLTAQQAADAKDSVRWRVFMDALCTQVVGGNHPLWTSALMLKKTPKTKAAALRQVTKAVDAAIDAAMSAGEQSNG
jgi:hypothetical protein